MALKCPTCHKLVKWEGNVFRPFCSQRCQLVDLEGWFGEHYRIPRTDEDEVDEQDMSEDSKISNNGQSSS